MATFESLVQRARLELSDIKEPFYHRFTGSGAGVRFELPVEHIDQFYLYPADEPENLLQEGEDGDYILQRRRGVVVFHNPPEIGKEFVAEGDNTSFLSDAEMSLIVQEAFDLHTKSRNPKPTFSSLDNTEVLLVAILAQINALWILKSSSAYEINVHAPEGMYIPRGQRFQQLNVMLQEAEQRYRDLSGALGVGLYAVEMFNLRRVSRLTGRYVPIYIDREVDDTRPPQRVFPNIGTQFGDRAETTVEAYDLQVFQGRPFTEVFELTENDEPLDIVGSEFEARMFRTPYQTSRFRDLLPQPTVTWNESESTVSLSYTAEETKRLETTGAYVWTLTWVTTSGDRVEILKGRILVEGSYPMKNVNVTVGP